MAHPAARATGSTAHESGTSSHIALGTVPDWVGAIGTTLAFFVAFVVFYLDVSERHRRQASQVTAWFERKAAEAVLHIVNSSDVPVYNIRVYPKLLGQVDEIIEYPVLGPRTDETRPAIPMPGSTHVSNRFFNVEISFADSAGRRWRRDGDGSLHRKYLKQVYF
jgi:hypothetical protein